MFRDNFFTSFLHKIQNAGLLQRVHPEIKSDSTPDKNQTVSAIPTCYAAVKLALEDYLGQSLDIIAPTPARSTTRPIIPIRKASHIAA